MPDKPPWILETTDATFEQDVVERSKELPVVVDFWAEWCAPCRMLAPTLEKLASEYTGRFVLVKANTEVTPHAAGRCGVQGIPAVFGFRDGELIDAFVGALPEGQIKLWLDRLLPTEAELRATEAGKIAPSNPAAAEQGYREALQLDPDLAKAKIGLAALLATQLRLEEGQALIEDLERRGYLEPEAEKVKAELELQLKAKEVGSVDGCRAAAQADPGNPKLQFELAEALAAFGNYEEALETSLLLVRDHKEQFGEQARKMMVDIFRLLPEDSELTSNYRRKLASTLY